jgi:hypothetical protein
MQPKALLLLSSDLIDAGSRMCSSCLVYWYHAVATVRPNGQYDPLPSVPTLPALRCAPTGGSALLSSRPSSPLGAGGHLSPPGWLKSGRTDGRTVAPCADRPTGGEARPSKVLGGHRTGRITGHHTMLALHVGVTFPGAAVLARGGTGLLYLGKTTWSSAQRSTAPISSDSTVRSASLLQSFSAVGWGYGIPYGGSFSLSVISVGLPLP